MEKFVIKKLDHSQIQQDIHWFKNKQPSTENLVIYIWDQIVDEIKFPDHHKYSKKDLENLINKKEENNSILITTEKDYLRIDENYKKNISFLKIEVQVENRDKFIDQIKKII